MREIVILLFLRFVVSLARLVIGIVFAGRRFFEFAVPDLFDLVYLFLAETYPLTGLLALGSLLWSQIFLIFGISITWLVVQGLLSQASKLERHLGNLAHIHTTCLLAWREVEVFLTFKLNLDEGFQCRNVLAVEALSEGVQNYDRLLMRDVAEWIGLDHVEHSLNNFGL